MTEEQKNENQVGPEEQASQEQKPPETPVNQTDKPTSTTPEDPRIKARREMLEKQSAATRAIQQILDQAGLTIVVEHNVSIVPKQRM